VRHAAALRARMRSDGGTALVEFFWLGVLLLVPLVYAILFAFDLQRASFAVTEATRSAGRAFVTTPDADVADASARAVAAAEMTFADHGVAASTYTIDAPECRDSGCFAAGGTVRITVHVKVQLPLLPTFGIAGGVVPVTGIHDEVFDSYADYGAPAP
jgi:Flp pilus assembly protein TadG